MRYISVITVAALVAGCTAQAPNDYVGEPVVLQTASDTTLPVTTQQPVLTQVLPTEQPVTAPQPMTPLTPSGAISDEQDFTAVSTRESIESDAARIAANRQLYTVIQPTDLPSRPGSGPNIVDYALATNHPVGAALYTRIGINTENRALRNCARYASSDLAQQDFLARGGPDRDRYGLDPDGDGYACKWDPTPFRLVRASIPPAQTAQ